MCGDGDAAGQGWGDWGVEKVTCSYANLVYLQSKGSGNVADDGWCCYPGKTTAENMDKTECDDNYYCSWDETNNACVRKSLCDMDTKTCASFTVHPGDSCESDADCSPCADNCGC